MVHELQLHEEFHDVVDLVESVIRGQQRRNNINTSLVGWVTSIDPDATEPVTVELIDGSTIHPKQKISTVPLIEGEKYCLGYSSGDYYILGRLHKITETELDVDHDHDDFYAPISHPHDLPAPDIAKIDEGETLSGGRTLIFRDIPQEFRHLFILGTGSFTNSVASLQPVAMRFNNHAGTDYHGIRWSGSAASGSISVSHLSSQDSIDWDIGQDRSVFFVFIPKYAQHANSSAHALALCFASDGSGGTGQKLSIVGGISTGASAAGRPVTEVRFVLPIDVFWSDFTTLSLYGLR